MWSGQPISRKKRANLACSRRLSRLAVLSLVLPRALASTAQQTAGQKAAPLAALTPEEADAIVAMTERILPSVDGRAGAREAGVVYFIDRSLATFNSAQRTLYSEGVKDLNAQAARKPGGASSFAAAEAQMLGEKGGLGKILLLVPDSQH
jgi:gluconate 2-dehydrogenase subunit 3-like protein